MKKKREKNFYHKKKKCSLSRHNKFTIWNINEWKRKCINIFINAKYLFHIFLCSRELHQSIASMDATCAWVYNKRTCTNLEQTREIIQYSVCVCICVSVCAHYLILFFYLVFGSVMKQWPCWNTALRRRVASLGTESNEHPSNSSQEFYVIQQSNTQTYNIYI